MAICVLLDESFCVSLLQCYEGYEYAEEVGVRIGVRFACCAEKVGTCQVGKAWLFD